MDIRNHDITNKIALILNDIKGFDVEMGNPKNGEIIVRYKGVNFYVSINPIFNNNEGRKLESEPFEKVVDEHDWVFRYIEERK